MVRGKRVQKSHNEWGLRQGHLYIYPLRDSVPVLYLYCVSSFYPVLLLYSFCFHQLCTVCPLANPLSIRYICLLSGISPLNILLRSGKDPLHIRFIRYMFDTAPLTGQITGQLQDYNGYIPNTYRTCTGQVQDNSGENGLIPEKNRTLWSGGVRSKFWTCSKLGTDTPVYPRTRNAFDGW
jgi:hypothetical protein